MKNYLFCLFFFCLSCVQLDAQVEEAKVYFLGIGVEELQPGITAKDHAIADIQSVSRRTHRDIDSNSMVTYNLKDDSVLVTEMQDYFLFNEDATLENIDSVFNLIGKTIRPQDIFYFYLSAPTYGNKGYLQLPRKAVGGSVNAGDANSLEYDIISPQNLNIMFPRIQCRFQIILIDHWAWNNYGKSANSSFFSQSSEHKKTQVRISPWLDNNVPFVYDSVEISEFSYILCITAMPVLGGIRKDGYEVFDIQASLISASLSATGSEEFSPQVSIYNTSNLLQPSDTLSIQTKGLDRGFHVNPINGPGLTAIQRIPEKYEVESGSDFFPDSIEVDIGIFRIQGDDTVLVTNGRTFPGKYCLRYYWKDKRKSENRLPVAAQMYIGSIDTMGTQTWLSFPGVRKKIAESYVFFGVDGKRQGVSMLYTRDQQPFVFEVTPPFGRDKIFLLLRQQPLSETKNYQSEIILREYNNPMSIFSTDYLIVHYYISQPDPVINRLVQPEIGQVEAAKALPPDLRVIKPENTRGIDLTNSISYTVRGSAYHVAGIQSVTVNGIPVHYDSLLRNFEARIELKDGNNSISVRATSKSGTVAVDEFTVACNAGQTVAAHPGKTWFLGIGIDKYEIWQPLNNAVSDMLAVETALCKNYQFSTDNHMILTDNMATREGILDSVRAMVMRLDTSDNLIIYYSGHGYFDPVFQEGYWVPVNGRTAKPSDYISNGEILKIIAAYKVKHFVLIVDACFAGSLFSQDLTARGDNTFTGKVEAFNSRWGLCSGRVETVSDGKAGGHSPFAAAVLDYLAQSKSDFTISELSNHVMKTVGTNANQTPVSGRFRDAGDKGGEFVFHRRE